MAASAGACHPATAARRGHVRRPAAHRMGCSGRSPRPAAHLSLGCSTRLPDRSRSCACGHRRSAHCARFAPASLERGLAAAAELATLDTSLRPGNGLPHAGGYATAFIDA